MFNCTTDRYNEIYAPWLANPRHLLHLAEYQPGKDRLIDLCGGTGAVTKAAVFGPWGKGRPIPEPDITLVDLNPRLDWEWTSDHCRQVAGDAERLDEVLGPRSLGAYDVVICRQAMAYLDPEKTAAAVARVLRPGGRFVFNTFVQPRRFGFRRYDYNGVKFGEAHLFWRGKVYHLQARLSHRPGYDISVFHYHPENRLRKALSPWFDFRVDRTGRSLRWVCTRKGDA